jgi:hypothetical protein
MNNTIKMKTLEELKIDTHKILRDDDLLELKGGWCGECVVSCGSGTFYGPCCETTQLMAEIMCGAYWGQAGCACVAFEV